MGQYQQSQHQPNAQRQQNRSPTAPLEPDLVAHGSQQRSAKEPERGRDGPNHGHEGVAKANTEQDGRHEGRLGGVRELDAHDEQRQPDELPAGFGSGRGSEFGW